VRLFNNSGSVLIETAFSIPVLLTIIIGGIDLTWAVNVKSQLMFASQQAAIVEAAAPNTGTAWGVAHFPSAQFIVTSPGCISATMTYSPLFLPANWFPILGNVACAAVITS
jgi:hypothetical protein